jgi:hypothetical protein
MALLIIHNKCDFSFWTRQNTLKGNSNITLYKDYKIFLAQNDFFQLVMKNA